MDTSTDTSKLFSPLRLNDRVALQHRIVLAPLTRNRGTEPSLCPHEAHVQYYSQRATPGGLLITEATNISPEAVGYLSVPGIWTDEQTRAWRRVTDAVHAQGAAIFVQLWHVGRVANPSFGSHPLLRNSGRALPSVSASALAMVHPKTGRALKTETYRGVEVHETPRALRTDEIPRLCEDYALAARNALAAGFDGVEVHAAHGYLLDQFLRDGTNRRTDQYGGSLENRCRLLVEVARAVYAVVGPGRMSVRLSPTTIDATTGRENMSYFAASCSDPDAIYEMAVAAMNEFKLAYLLLTEPRWNSKFDDKLKADPGFSKPLSNAKYRRIFHGTLAAAGGFTPRSASKALEQGHFDLVAFGRFFISNPDLVSRIRRGSALNVYDRSTFYTSTSQGGGGRGLHRLPR